MKRTTIFLPDEVHERLRQEAFAARISMARLIRSRLEQGTARRRTRDGDPLAKVEGIVQDGGLTEGIDEALYSS
jgi:predicted transcriptional regulator